MIWPLPPFTRRSFALSLLLTPMACLGCGGGGVTVETEGGAKRREKMEDLQKRADSKRNSGGKKAPSR